MVDIQIATGNTRLETRDLMLSYVDLGKELGRTTQSIAQASNDWLRAGYQGKEAAELTKASMMLSTLGMIDAGSATTYLISTLKGWKISASEVINVVDKLTAVDMAAAVSAGDLALAMSRANNSARLAGRVARMYSNIHKDFSQIGQSPIYCS
jgi:TP901 family phage tail tape measure protein